MTSPWIEEPEVWKAFVEAHGPEKGEHYLKQWFMYYSTEYHWFSLSFKRGGRR